MSAHAMVTPPWVKSGASVADRATEPPPASAASSSANPTIDASTVFPGRTTFIQKPMPSAIGMVQRREKTPQGLSLSALVTTRASTARRMIMMARIASMASIPVTGPTSSLAICPSDLPSRRIDPKRMTKSWTAPPSTTPNTIQMVPGSQPNCAARTGPTSGPAPAMAARWWPNRTQRGGGAGDRARVGAEQTPAGRREEVPPVVQPLGGGRPAAVEAQHPLGEEAAVEAIADEVGAHRREHQPGGADGFPAVKGDDSPRRGAHQTDPHPEQSAHAPMYGGARGY